jgi:RNA polymerase sigma-70 factor (ECF subfamily)
MGPIGAEQLGQWFDAYAAGLLLYARQWVEAPSAEDLVQEAFLRLFVQRRSPANVKAWLFRCVRNGALDALRSRRRRQKRQPVAGRREWFDARLDDGLDARAAQAALESLPPEKREVVVMRIWGEMTLREIAEVLGEPVSTVFSRYRSGLAAVRRIMEKSPCQQKNG